MKLVSSAGLLAGAIAIVAPASAQTADWTGLYFGGSAGYATAGREDAELLAFDTNFDHAYNNTVRTAAGADAFSPGFCDGAAYGTTPAAGCRNNEDAGFLSLRAGYDYQIGNLVVGALADVSTVNLSDAMSGFSTTPASYTFNRHVNYTAGLRGRAGYALGQGLFYGTAGGVWADVDHTFSTTNTANAFGPSDPGEVWGYQVGGGFEYQWTDRLSFGLEFLYTQLDDDDYTIGVSRGTAPATNPFVLQNPAGTLIRRSDDEFGYHNVGLTMAWRS